MKNEGITNTKDSLGTRMKSWCEHDNHHLYERYSDFNEWIDSDEGQHVREEYRIEGLLQPSKAFYASDCSSYNQVLNTYRKNRKDCILNRSYICKQFDGEHWFIRNSSRFDQLVDLMSEGTVVPFVGAGLSVEGGFPTWGQHLQQQGRTSRIDQSHVNELLSSGQYEAVIEDIENKGYREAFIQELKDVFSQKGEITETSLRVVELFTDTIITTNYDHLIEQACEVRYGAEIQLIECSDILQKAEDNKTTIVKLHGDVNNAANCILGKSQYNEAYGKDDLDLSKPIPKLLSYYYKNSNLLFLGCSLNKDRTMQVFQAVKDEMGDIYRPPHFSIEQMPETEDELSERNAYLLSFGITPIWFPTGRYELIEEILLLVKNELKYRGFNIEKKKVAIEEKSFPVVKIEKTLMPEILIVTEVI